MTSVNLLRLEGGGLYKTKIDICGEELRDMPISSKDLYLFRDIWLSFKDFLYKKPTPPPLLPLGICLKVYPEDLSSYAMTGYLVGL